MKTIIAGGRDIHDKEILLQAINESGFEITHVIVGGAPGVDTMAEEWAREKNLTGEIHNADWRKFGKAAGPIRNRVMAEHGEALIAIWDGVSRGTKNMIEEATKRKLKVYVYRTDEYHLATLEDALEFDKRRNYHYTNTTNPIDFPKECYVQRSEYFQAQFDDKE
jgi:hypothetical protein